MTTPNYSGPRNIGLAWFREEDYPALLSIFADGPRMPRSWKEWAEKAEIMEADLKDQHHKTERVYIDPKTFPDWCKENGVEADRQGRYQFVAMTIAAKYGTPP